MLIGGHCRSEGEEKRYQARKERGHFAEYAKDPTSTAARQRSRDMDLRNARDRESRKRNKSFRVGQK